MIKSSIIIILLLFLTAFGVVWASQTNVEFEKKLYPIDIELEKCVTKNYMTEDMNQCVKKGIEAWNKEITDYSNQIKKKLDKENLEIFETTQIAWKNYYIKEKIFLFKTIYPLDGDIHTTFVFENLYELTKQHALILKSYLFELTN